MAVAVVTGASRGLGRALARALAAEGWSLVLDARGAEALGALAAELEGPVVALPGDVADPAHRAELVSAAQGLGGIDLLVNNASVLGAEPLVPLAEQSLTGFAEALTVNTVAPLGLVQEALPLLRESGGAVLNISSDAAVEAYETWGGYGASKAALDHWSAVLAQEEPALRVWSVDPGDMRTAMYAAAVPDDDDSGRPLPEEGAVPALLELIGSGAASGRYSVSGRTAKEWTR
ncbi:SDR family NAD(P)-dependent oxidoreductase [Streptacidiphilus carbonis]|jgi:NAD(P)-dependent dehydrogenase (short-subunit alcohol dehydrogenase family)|uniref:SDR family NAD(P)-dependent oxidoreductase n=1 Tax=Streptacidiphilus carbonis TaxID=105422 RepID=UPI0005AADB55|nr:SDR family NAD(P)-dependent oxidoreductase [Streptacidiphilus carbonis]